MRASQPIEGITYELLQCGIWSPSHTYFSAPTKMRDEKILSKYSIGKQSEKGVDDLYSESRFSDDINSEWFEKAPIPMRRGFSPKSIQDKIEISKNDSIIKLEELLSKEYNSKVDVTCINELPMTRKSVKEVYFLINSGLAKVWVFKADPIKTKRELEIYNIAYRNNLPTGRPIGFSDEKNSQYYPYNIAIIGGEIIEHAGEPYAALMKNLREKPSIVYRTAQSIASMIANYQITLTNSLKEFRERNVEIKELTPKKEIKERVATYLKIDDRNIEGLVRSFEALYQNLSSTRVVSHGDLHTGNIVTFVQNEPQIQKMVTKIDRFGIIDWDSLGMDNPLGDAVDFWVHHSRQARAICDTYNFSTDDFADLFIGEFNNLGKKHGLYLEKLSCIRDTCIESALWNLYEMFDPVRKDQKDIENKAKTHLSSLLVELKKLESFSMHEEVYDARKELNDLFSQIEYLKETFSKN